MSEDCMICFENDDYEGPPPNCPNCGRFLRWNGWDEGYSCKCNGIITIPGSGDPDYDDSDFALRVCKISQFIEKGDKDE